MPGKRGKGEGLLEDALAALARALDEAGAPWMVIGGIAVIAHGVRRFTTDIDAAVLGDAIAIDRLLEALARYGIAPRIADAAAFARDNLVLLVRHAPTGVDLDISLAWYRPSIELAQPPSIEPSIDPARTKEPTTTEEPRAEEPRAEEPRAEEPRAEEPRTEEPATCESKPPCGLPAQPPHACESQAPCDDDPAGEPRGEELRAPPMVDPPGMISVRAAHGWLMIPKAWLEPMAPLSTHATLAHLLRSSPAAL